MRRRWRNAQDRREAWAHEERLRRGLTRCEPLHKIHRGIRMKLYRQDGGYLVAAPVLGLWRKEWHEISSAAAFMAMRKRIDELLGDENEEAA